MKSFIKVNARSAFSSFVFAILALLCAAPTTQAGSVPNTFIAGTQAKAADVNANFAYLENLINAMADKLVPPGTIVAFAGITPPAGWLLCDGRAVSKATYAELFAVIGIVYGPGDGVTTFNLPDYRGYFLRGVDGTAGRDPDKDSRGKMNGIGLNSGNQIGSVQAHQYTQHRHIEGSGIYNQDGSARTIYDYAEISSPWTVWADWGYSAETNRHSATSYEGGSETRPVNAYVNYIVKY